jgi:hypothetical protein
MNDTVGVVIIAIAIGSLGIAFLWQQVKTGGSTSPAAYKYQRKPLLEKEESAFFLKLKEAMHGYEIFPGVAMLAFLRPTRGGAKKDDSNTPAFNAIARKRAAFVVCKQDTLQVLAIAELDCSKNGLQRREASWRDLGAASAGIPTIRWAASETPTPENIRSAILEAIGDSKSVAP